MMKLAINLWSCAVGERNEGSPKRLNRNEVSECQRRHKSVPVSGGINTSNLYSAGIL